MPEWWTYTLEDFLMFSPATYGRVLDQYHRAVWPGQLVGAAIGTLAAAIALSPKAKTMRAEAWLLALAWLWVAWAFYARSYATIHWAAGYLAAMFVFQTLLLLMLGMISFGRAVTPGKGLRVTGWMAVAAGLVLLPVASVWLGRPWSQAEVFGVSPHATALTTLGLTLASVRLATPGRWLLSIVPVLSLAEGAATLASLALAQSG
jgi:Family of unknown function (DUF6064)